MWCTFCIPSFSLLSIRNSVPKPCSLLSKTLQSPKVIPKDKIDSKMTMVSFWKLVNIFPTQLHTNLLSSLKLYRTLNHFKLLITPTQSPTFRIIHETYKTGMIQVVGLIRQIERRKLAPSTHSPQLPMPPSILLPIKQQTVQKRITWVTPPLPLVTNHREPDPKLLGTIDISNVKDSRATTNKTSQRTVKAVWSNISHA